MNVLIKQMLRAAQRPSLSLSAHRKKAAWVPSASRLNSWTVHSFGSRSAGGSLWCKLITLPVKFFFFSCLSFIFLSMTGHLWCHASTGWAFLRHRSWCHRLSDLVYRTPGTFCDINEIPSGKDSDEREQPQAMCLKDKRVGCRVVALPCRTRLGGADITMLRARNVAFMCNCSHTHTRACYVLSRV